MRLRRHSTRSCPADIPCVSFRSQSVKNPPTHPAVKNGKGRFPPEPAKTVTTQLSYRCRIFPASRAALRSCLYWPTQVLKHRREPRHSPREGCLAARIVPAITIDRLVIAITSSEARCWHAAQCKAPGLSGSVREGRNFGMLPVQTEGDTTCRKTAWLPSRRCCCVDPSRPCSAYLHRL